MAVRGASALFTLCAFTSVYAKPPICARGSFRFPVRNERSKARFPGGAEKCLEAPSFYLLLCRTTLEFFMNAPPQSSPIVSSPLIFTGIAFPERNIQRRSLGEMRAESSPDSALRPHEVRRWKRKLYATSFSRSFRLHTRPENARRLRAPRRRERSADGIRCSKKGDPVFGSPFSISRAVSPKPSGRNV
jgi:hypothetical protein